MTFVCVVCRDLISANPGEDAGAAAAANVQADVIATSCGHVYHLTCLQGWLLHRQNPRQNCPYCQSGINEREFRRLFLVGDEEAADIEKLQKVLKTNKKESENLHNAKVKLESEIKTKVTTIQDQHLVVDILNYELDRMGKKITEVEKEKEELQQLWQNSEADHQEIVAKMREEKAALQENQGLLQAKIASMEKQLAEAAKKIDMLKTENSLQAEQKLIREEFKSGNASQAKPAAPLFKSSPLVRSNTFASGSKGRGASNYVAAFSKSQADTSGSGVRLGTSSTTKPTDVTDSDSDSDLDTIGEVMACQSIDNMMHQMSIKGNKGTKASDPKPSASNTERSQPPTTTNQVPKVKTGPVSELQNGGMVSMGRGRGYKMVSMKTQTDKLDVAFALDLLNREEPLSLCIQILEEERRKKEAGSPSRMNGHH